MKFNNRNISVSEKANIGHNVKIGDNTIIYDNVEIGDNSVICNNCIIGEPLLDYYRNDEYSNPPLVIGANSLIRSHAIIYAASNIGDFFSTGHHVTIREYSTIGSHCNIGTASDIQGDLTIGNYCRLYSYVSIGKYSKIGNFVFMYPYTVITNDPHPPSNDLAGATIGDYTQVAVHSVILSGVKIGENCLIGANSLVNNAIPDYTFVISEPSKSMMDIRKFITLRGKGRYYPWMYHFERGMPWEGIGFDNWMKGSQNK